MRFSELVGQERTKSKINFFLEASEVGEPFPTSMLTGSKGYGKTAILEATATELKEQAAKKGVEKRGMIVNAAGIKNLKSFFSSVVIPVVNDRDVTLCIDECSELPNDVTMALLTMTNPNAEHRNSFTYADYTVDVDLRRQTFLFATTEPQEVFPPLMNRCERFDLEPYSFDELGKILKKHAPDVKFDKHVLEQFAPTLRTNARTTVLMARKVKAFLAPQHRHNFTMADWQALSKRLDILPLGLSRHELQVLRILGSRRDSSLTRLAASLGMTPQAVRQDCELYLLSAGLMEISTGGRNISPKGQELLKQIDALKVG
jgi:Holliday junction resolvasome RuvABC ATP-dependent DNA helicase subunit